MKTPIPTPIYRLIHIETLEAYLTRRTLHAPNFAPDDGLRYYQICDQEVQTSRSTRIVPCGPGGEITDFIPFHFDPRSVMLFTLGRGYISTYRGGQEALIHLVALAQEVEQAGLQLVFTDGHGLAHYTQWFDDLSDLEEIDWEAVNARYWKDTDEDPDKKRRKQAEFLIHQQCPWDLIRSIVVINQRIKLRVETILAKYPEELRRIVHVERAWYY